MSKRKRNSAPIKDQITVGEQELTTYQSLFSSEESKSKKAKNNFIGKLLKINAWQIILTSLLYIIQAAPTYIMPICSANIINIVTEAIKTGNTDGVYLKLGINLGVLAISILQNVPTTILRYGIVSKLIRKISASIKCMLVRKLQLLSITYHKNMQKGKVQSKFIKDTEAIDTFITNLFQSLIPNIISVIVATIISLYTSWMVSLFFVVIIPINVTLMVFCRKKLRMAARDYRVKTEIMSARLNTMMVMMPITKSHGLQQVEINDLDHTITDLAGSGVKMDRRIANFGAWVWVINVLLKSICFVFCAYLALKGIIGVGEIVLFESMFSQISNSVTALVNCLPIFTTGMESVRSVAEIMHATDVEKDYGKPLSPCFEGNIRFENVFYKYPDTTEYAVDNLSFEAKKGECIAFVGASGSGKSTVMNLLIGFMEVTAGEIFIDEKPLSEYNLTQYRSHISVVPQSSILFPGTIKENITYGLAHITDEQINKAVEMANITEFMPLLPKGLDTDVGELGDKLSGGQRQRITIARALVRNPRILILDEATSALDNISELHVQKAISNSIAGRTTFIVAHRLSTIRDADKIVVMDKGKCVEFGTYEELMAKKGKFYQLKQLSEMETNSASVEIE